MLRHLLRKIQKNFHLIWFTIAHLLLFYSMYYHFYLIQGFVIYAIAAIYYVIKSAQLDKMRELNLREEIENEIRFHGSSKIKPLIDQIYDSKRLELTKLYANEKVPYNNEDNHKIHILSRAIADIGDGWDEALREKKMRIYWPEEFAAAEQNSTNQA